MEKTIRIKDKPRTRSLIEVEHAIMWVAIGKLNNLLAVQHLQTALKTLFSR